MGGINLVIILELSFSSFVILWLHVYLNSLQFCKLLINGINILWLVSPFQITLTDMISQIHNVMKPSKCYPQLLCDQNVALVIGYNYNITLILFCSLIPDCMLFFKMVPIIFNFFH